MLNISRESEVNIVNTLIDHDVISGTDLIKIKQASNDKEVTTTLMTDPDSGRSMSYAESRMKFG